ncbi:hypothetical protein ABIC27_004807 [Streptomyces sp. PvR034]
MRTHYPRTPHLPWSPGATPDDVRAGDLSGLPGLRGREVVVTEKLDGSNFHSSQQHVQPTNRH